MADPATILIVDDQPTLMAAIRVALEMAGHNVVSAENGSEALDRIQAEEIDLILADIGMPRMNGYQLHERVRENPAWGHIPFIFLTARAMDSDIRYGKELGVDDYLTKPIEPDDLLAAVNGKLRRSQMMNAAASHKAQTVTVSSKQFEIGALRIEPASHRVWWKGDAVELSPREFVLLGHLARHAEEVVSHQDLVRITHDLHTDNEDASSLIRPLIRSIRRKLGAGVGEIGCIETVRGVGYRLTTEPA